MTFLIAILCIALILGLIYAWLYRKVSKHIPENYPNAKNLRQIDTSKKVLVCFGDSNTHGNVSFLNRFNASGSNLTSDIQISSNSSIISNRFTIEKTQLGQQIIYNK